MTLKQMQYFASICQTQNMSQSARELYVSQPTMSVAIKDLESEVGSEFWRECSATRVTLSFRMLRL